MERFENGSGMSGFRSLQNDLIDWIDYDIEQHGLAVCRVLRDIS